jgi:tetrahydromethanopterin S-methyltransferase subunit D
MKGKVWLGILMLVVGFIAAVYGFGGVSQPNDVRDQAPVVGDQNQPQRQEIASVLVPVIAGVSLAAGAALVGLGMGAFRRPKIVPPESPEASRAATTRGTS